MKKHLFALIVVLFQLLYALSYFGAITVLCYNAITIKDPSRILYLSTALIMVYVYGLKPEPKYESKTTKKGRCEACGSNCCHGSVAKRFTDSGFN